MSRNKWVIRILLVLSMSAAMGLMVASAFAQDDPGSAPNTIVVRGTGSASGEPDIAFLEMGVNTFNEDVSAGFSDINTAMDDILAALSELGISDSDVQTTGINLYTEDRYDPQSGGPTGERTYRLSNTVRVIVRDVDMVEDVINTGVEAGANQIYGLNFGIDDRTALMSEARADAVADAEARAAELANLLGMTLGEPVSAREVNNQGDALPPFASYGGLGGGGGAPVEAGQLSVTASVEITFAVISGN